MIGEINIDGVFISPLLLCPVCAFFSRMALSDAQRGRRLSLVAQRPLFDTALFLILAGLFSTA